MSGWSEEIEAGSPSLESIVFVLAGMIATIAVLIHMYLVFTG